MGSCLRRRWPIDSAMFSASFALLTFILTENATRLTENVTWVAGIFALSFGEVFSSGDGRKPKIPGRVGKIIKFKENGV